MDYIPVEEMLHNARDMTKLQEQFLEMTTMDVEDNQRKVSTNKRREIFTAVEIPSFKRT
ncbi:hypothetical protein BGX30_007917, partial [Mortierella sp. GBA39]